MVGMFFVSVLLTWSVGSLQVSFEVGSVMSFVEPTMAVIETERFSRIV